MEKSNQFYNIPKILFKDPKYNHLSSDAKLLYSLLLDYVETPIIIPRVSVQEILNITPRMCCKAFKDLRESNLIHEIKQCGSYTEIYLNETKGEN